MNYTDRQIHIEQGITLSGPRMSSEWAEQQAEARDISPVERRFEYFSAALNHQANAFRECIGYDGLSKGDRKTVDRMLTVRSSEVLIALGEVNFNEGGSYDCSLFTDDDTAELAEAWESGDTRRLRVAASRVLFRWTHPEATFSRTSPSKIPAKAQEGGEGEGNNLGRLDVERKLSTGLPDPDVAGMAREWGVTEAMARAQSAPLSEASQKWMPKADATTRFVLRGKRGRVTTREDINRPSRVTRLRTPTNAEAYRQHKQAVQRYG